MKWTAIWLPEADQELARIWLASSNRSSVTAAAERIDGLLQAEPESAGESRSEGRRILIDLPLAVKFRVVPDDRLVVVSTVWEIRTRTK